MTRFKTTFAFETIIVKDMIIGDVDFIKKYMIKTILHQEETSTIVECLEVANTRSQSNTVQELKVNSVVMKNTCCGKEDSNSKIAFNKLVKESNMNSETKA
ncbi:hypothetical protein Tco_0854405 [Tanacetum coccineum]